MKIDPSLKKDLKEYIASRLADTKKDVTVLSASEMNEKLKKLLKERFPMLEHARIHYEIDTTLIAGVVIQFGSKIIDLSVRNELQNLQQRIYDID